MDDYLKTVPHSENQFRKEQGWDDKFVVMYSGNHSLVHPLDTILDAAEQLKDDDRFVFAFIGGGKGKQAVEERVQRSEVRDQKSEKAISDSQNFKVSAFPKIISMPYQALNMIKFSLSAADLHIVSLGNDMSGIVHPCKIYGALSIGRPVLTLGPKKSYLSDILEEARGQRTEAREQQTEETRSCALQPQFEKHEKSGTSRVNPQPSPTPHSSLSTLHSAEGQSHSAVGWAIEHGDVAAVVSALKAAADQTQKERAAMGQRAQQIASEKFGRKQLVQQFLQTIL
jgi:glycosyltransferase involved in cell wall biosynthesis